MRFDPVFQARPYVENEFESARFDPATGQDPDALYEQLLKLQQSDDPRPYPIRCSEAFAYLLDNVRLEINEHTPFSVKLGLGIDFSDFATRDVFCRAFFQTRRPKVLKELFPKEFAEMVKRARVGLGTAYTDFWHTVPDWSYLLELGFPGLLEKAEAQKATLPEGSENDPRWIFWESVAIRYRAILRLLTRIRDYSRSFNVPDFTESVSHLLQGPPANLYDVMQFSVFYLYFEEIGIERGRTLGPIDQLYEPFCRELLKTEEGPREAEELFAYFFLHFTAAKGFAQQPLTICGSNEDGSDRTNAVSHLILRVYDSLSIYDPKIHVRYHKNLDPALLDLVLRMIRGGNNSICLVNDEAVYRGYDRIDIPRSDAQDYVILGCYEPIIMGKEEGEIAPDRLNMVKCIEFALNGGRDLLTDQQVGPETPMEIPDFESFFRVFLQQLDAAMDFDLKFVQMQEKVCTLVNPSPIYSSSFRDCMEQGKDVHEFPLPYNNLSLKPFGLATVVDSLMAVKKFVYEQKALTLAELRRALLANWEGFETLRATILADQEKYGNALPEPDALTVAITDHMAKRYCGKRLERGGALRLGLDSVYHCVNIAPKTAASPDGRLAGTPVSKNLCSTDGMDRGGITALMQSILKIDSADYLDATVLDFMLHPSAVEGERGLAAFRTLLQVFFEQGGFAAQGNIVSGETLRQAQLHPEKYSTLQVRVCGWNEYFVKLSKTKQDMFIKQCEVMG